MFFVCASSDLAVYHISGQNNNYLHCENLVCMHYVGLCDSTPGLPCDCLLFHLARSKSPTIFYVVSAR